MFPDDPLQVQGVQSTKPHNTTVVILLSTSTLSAYSRIPRHLLEQHTINQGEWQHATTLDHRNFFVKMYLLCGRYFTQSYSLKRKQILLLLLLFNIFIKPIY